ncbi:MAG: M23 family metallopeptidase [Bacteroidales bacterium]|nr:M23 family metallopeptidase [Bacteroidales bacterium]
MPQNIYYFNPKTLSFEKKQFSWKDVLKRVAWFMATALSFSVIIIWISFYLIDSPKELMLRRENNELKEQIKKMDKRIDQLTLVARDMQERDDHIYRSIFESDPVPMSERYPFLVQKSGYENINSPDAAALLSEIQHKADKLCVALSVQSRSFDTISDLVNKKKEMLRCIPAIRPLPNIYEVSSGFGYRYHPILKVLRPHTGIDISAAKGTPVYATADGVVSRKNAGSGYGTVVIIDHGYSYQTLYAHLSKKNVKPGEKVVRGQVIGFVGNTGLSLGAHLHYEVIKDGQRVNPVHYFFQDITPEEYDAILKSSQKVNQALS